MSWQGKCKGHLPPSPTWMISAFSLPSTCALHTSMPETSASEAVALCRRRRYLAKMPAVSCTRGLPVLQSVHHAPEESLGHYFVQGGVGVAADLGGDRVRIQPIHHL